MRYIHSILSCHWVFHVHPRPALEKKERRVWREKRFSSSEKRISFALEPKEKGLLLSRMTFISGSSTWIAYTMRGGEGGDIIRDHNYFVAAAVPLHFLSLNWPRIHSIFDHKRRSRRRVLRGYSDVKLLKLRSAAMTLRAKRQRIRSLFSSRRQCVITTLQQQQQQRRATEN